MAIDNIAEKCLKRLDPVLEEMTLEDKLQKIGVSNVVSRFTGTMYLVKQNEVPYQYYFVSQYQYTCNNTNIK